MMLILLNANFEKHTAFYTTNCFDCKNIYNYKIGLFMYKYVNNMTPNVFH